MQTIRKKTLFALFGGLALLLAACGPSAAELTPTVNPDTIRTEAVGTFSSSLTQTAIALPTATLTVTPMPTITLPVLTTPFSTLAAGTGTAVGGVPLCTRLVYVTDVTIPDNTQMTPGQSFTKTWRVQNTGTCAWTTAFKFSLIGGDAMGAQALALPQTVAPGASYDISVPMTAPTGKTGTITGTWRMADDKGTFFGDSLTVVIVIGGTGATTTSTPGATSTQGAAATSTSSGPPTSTVTVTPTP